MALLTPALIGVSFIFKTGGIRAGVKGAGVKKGPAEKGPIRYMQINLLTPFCSVKMLQIFFVSGFTTNKCESVLMKLL